MTIDELREALDRIPKTGAISKARRQMIQRQIAQMMQEGR